MPGLTTSPAEVNNTPPEQAKSAAKTSLYTIVDIPNKGRGLKASTAIRKGTRIFAEAPLVLVDQPIKTDLAKSDEKIATKLENVSLEVVSAILNMHNAHLDTQPELVGIVHTNAFHIDDGEVGLFKVACLMNHSCRPNVEAEWDPYLGKLVVHANQDIRQDEE